MFALVSRIRRCCVHQVQYNVHSALHQAADLIDDILEYGDPMHWPDGCLVAAARMLLNTEAAMESYVARKYTQALAEAHMASWDILRMPEHTRATRKQLNVLPSEDAVRERMGYNPLPP